MVSGMVQVASRRTGPAHIYHVWGLTRSLKCALFSERACINQGPKNAVCPLLVEEGNNKITNTDFAPFSPIPPKHGKSRSCRKSGGWPVPLDPDRGSSEIDLRRRTPREGARGVAAPPKTGFLLLKSRAFHISLLAHTGEKKNTYTNTEKRRKSAEEFFTKVHVKGLVLQLFRDCNDSFWAVRFFVVVGFFFGES